MELNILSFCYLFLLLAPFILVCFFALSSIFNQDFKGLIYLIGLIFTCFISIFIGKTLPIQEKTNDKSDTNICNMINKVITIDGFPFPSKLPLSQLVYGYTFCYLLFVIIKYKYVMQNIPTLVFFPILILFDLYWNYSNNCNEITGMIAGLIVGSLCGLFWAYVIDKSNSKNLQYFAGINNNEVCSKPSAQTFKCDVYKNGQLLSTNFASN